MLQFDTEKWKLENGCEVLLYSLSTHLPIRVKPDGVIDACGDFNDPLGLLPPLAVITSVLKVTSDQIYVKNNA